MQISQVTGDKRETAWLWQRLSVAIVSGNAVSILATLPRDDRHLHRAVGTKHYFNIKPLDTDSTNSFLGEYAQDELHVCHISYNIGRLYNVLHEF